MHTNYLFIDTETSAKPKDLMASVNDLEAWPEVIQAAWVIYSPERSLLLERNFYIYNEGLTIDPNAEKVHGIDGQYLKENGVSRKQVARAFSGDLHRYKPVVVGHFVELDSKMMQVTQLRSGQKNTLAEYSHFCTMRSTSDYSNYRYHEFPQLRELYSKLVGDKLQGAHDALHDARATARVFYALVDRNEFNDELIRRNLFKVRDKFGRRRKHGKGCLTPLMFTLILTLFILYGWRIL